MFDLVHCFERHSDLGPDWVSPMLDELQDEFHRRERSLAFLGNDRQVNQTVDKDGTYTVTYTIPGFKKSEVVVELTRDKSLLLVSAQKDNKKVSGSCTLHPQYDESTIKAHLEDGILTVTYKLVAPTPKKENTKKIELT